MKNAIFFLKKEVLCVFIIPLYVTVGYSQQTILMTESFEGGTGTTPPAGWVIEQVTGATPGISFITSSSYPTITAAYHGTTFVRYNSYNISSGSTRLKRTTAMSTVNKSFVMVEFAWYEDPGYSTSADRVDIQWSTNGTTWTTAGTFNRYNAVAGWKLKNTILPTGASDQDTLFVAFLFTSAYGNNCALDMAKVTAGPLVPPAFVTIGTGATTVGWPYYTFYMGSRTQMLYTAAQLLAGGASAGPLISVGFNVATGYPQVMQNFTIKMGATTSTTLTDADGFYMIYNLAPGTVTINVTAPAYVAGSATSTIIGGQVTNLDIFLIPGPKMGGMVTDASTGAPVVGATISLAGVVQTLSVSNGIYLTPNLSMTGAQPVVIGKTGFNDFISTITLNANQTSELNAELLPTAVPPGPFIATPNGLPITAIHLNWQEPQGTYQLIYNDGGEENYVVWAYPNNLNALKFTPLSHPVTLMGGKINLGSSSNYPSGALPLTSFTVYAMKADGPGGTPGTIIDSALVTPNGFGWRDFIFSTPHIIQSGDFYLVMKQGGAPPHAARLGIDETVPAFRSYSRFATGGGNWLPAAGNFMIRAIVQGGGGPLMMENMSQPALITASAPEGLIYAFPVATQTGYEKRAIAFPADSPATLLYQVWRLRQGQEGSQNLWTAIYTGNATSATDFAWPALPDGPYRWAVKAIYSTPGQRLSAPTFSNVIGKNWESDVLVNVTLNCPDDPKTGTLVTLVNIDYPDTNYSIITNNIGTASFQNVWKGNYTLTVSMY